MTEPDSNLHSRTVHPQNRRLKTGFLVAFGSLILGLMLLEGFTRLFLPYPQKQINLLRMRAPDLQMDAASDVNHPGYNPFLQRRPHSKWVSDGKKPEPMNNEGFRDRDFVIEKQRGLFRIAVIGDSFTEGWMCPRGTSYPCVMTEKLGSNFEIENFGLANRSPLRYLALYHDIVRKYHPDALLLCLYRNDIQEDENLRDYVTWNQEGIPVHFDLQRYFHDTPRMPQTLWEKRMDKWQWLLCQNVRLYPYLAVYLEVTPAFRKKYLEATPSSNIDKLWPHTREYLSRLHHLTEEDHIPFFLTYAPDLGERDQVDPLWEKSREFAQTEHIPFFDPDHWMQQSDLESLYLKGDGHFSVLGHRRFGSLLSEWIRPQLNVSGDRISTKNSTRPPDHREREIDRM